GGAGALSPGAPQQTWPHGVGIPLPATFESQVKSGLIPEADRNAAPLGLAMIQCWPFIPFGTFPGTSRMTVFVVPSQLKVVSRVVATTFWVSASIRISTYWTLGSPPAPTMISEMCAMWNTARPVDGNKAIDASSRRAGQRMHG